MMKLSAWLSEFLPAFKRKIEDERMQARQSLRASAMVERDSADEVRPE
jgi:hypothetical protein